jgi:hypothetical protein
VCLTYQYLSTGEGEAAEGEGAEGAEGDGAFVFEIGLTYLIFVYIENTLIILNHH